MKRPTAEQLLKQEAGNYISTTRAVWNDMQKQGRGMFATATVSRMSEAFAKTAEENPAPYGISEKVTLLQHFDSLAQHAGQPQISAKLRPHILTQLLDELRQNNEALGTVMQSAASNLKQDLTPRSKDGKPLDFLKCTAIHGAVAPSLLESHLSARGPAVSATQVWGAMSANPYDPKAALKVESMAENSRRKRRSASRDTAATPPTSAPKEEVAVTPPSGGDTQDVSSVSLGMWGQLFSHQPAVRARVKGPRLTKTSKER